MPGDAEGLLLILGGSALSAILGLVYYTLRRTDRALERSNSAAIIGQQAISFTGNNMLLVSALQQAIFMQGNALDKWEDWGVDVKRRDADMQRALKEHGWIKEVTELRDPPSHLDLTELFSKMPGVTVAPPPNQAPREHDVDPTKGFNVFKAFKSGE